MSQACDGLSELGSQRTMEHGASLRHSPLSTLGRHLCWLWVATMADLHCFCASVALTHAVCTGHVAALWFLISA